MVLYVSCGSDHKKAAANSNVSNETRTSAETVFVCSGGHATRYHCDKNCFGLRNCKGDIIEMTETQALNMGRTRCRKCYK